MRYFIFFICVFFSYSICVAPTSAAIVKIESEVKTLRVEDMFSVEVILDTELQTVNAFETSIVFPRELLEYAASNEGESVLNLWIEKPNYNGVDTISFSGIVPGGFMQVHAPILTLTFKVIKEGQANIESVDSLLLLHDGLGTPTPVTSQNLHISVVSGGPAVTVYTVDDEIPESFVPEIVQDPDLFDGSTVLIFSTVDKGSGLDYFAVKEGWFGRYHLAESPYEVVYQGLDTKIYIKAVDKMGNERIEIFYPQNWQPWYKDLQIIATILVLCVLMGLISGWFLKRLLLK